MKFINFMLYTETEVFMGPNLNVIIGPNGSGKSTIVNGICIGLAGKPSILGRASKVGDFVQVGKDEAHIETELFNDAGPNIIVHRRFNSAGKTEWKLNGKKTTEKDIKERVAKMRIQVDNLCQFLPQDKVHEFSRLNNKDLLDSTIDAVGETGLKEKHSELRALQREFDEGDQIHAQKEKVYQDKVEKCNKMEDEVKIFKQKRDLMEKQEMLSKKRSWELFWRKKAECKDALGKEKEQEKIVIKAERSVAPLEKEIKEIKEKITKISRVKGTINDSEKECAAKAKIHCNKIEDCKRELNDLDDQETARIRKLKEKAKDKEKWESEIRVYEKDNRELDAEEDKLGMKITAAKIITKKATESLATERQHVDQKKYEITAQERELNRMNSQLDKLKDIDQRKMTKLKEIGPQVYEAVSWLRNNKENFRGEIYEPFLISCNVPAQEHAVYLESSINIRDMMIFFFSLEEDMNKFLNVVRDEKGLERVGAAMLPRRSIQDFMPKVSGQSLKKYGFVSYLKDMVVAPDPVLAYMCQQYNLHNTAVFHQNSEKYNDMILDLGINSYFFGHKKFSASRSNYSGKMSTRTTEVSPRFILGQSADQTRISELNKQADQFQETIHQLRVELESLVLSVKHLGTELEKRRIEERELDQTRILYNRNSAKIKKLKELLSAEDEQNFEAEKVNICSKKREAVIKMIKATGHLKTAIETSMKSSIETETKCIELGPLQARLDEKQNQLNNMVEGMDEMRRDLARLKKAKDDIQEEMVVKLRIAKTETGSNPDNKYRPPEKYMVYWEKEKFPDGIAQIDQLIGDLEAQLQCTGDVNQDVVERYRDLKEQIAELEKDIHNRDKNKKKQLRKIEEVRNTWLTGLKNLTHEIDTRYGKLLNHMGFAGRVGIHTGKHDNDFDNYGIKIQVKYRDLDDYQELDPHRQSGGERSVATAIYMLALQTLTTVPFRCVDEINQGMDPINERLVFDLLVQTSCQESNAQYFLLTPKLLPDLKYNPRMNVLVVNNGPHLPHYTEWSPDNITSFPRAG